MSFSYDHTLSRDLDKVRFLLDDKSKSAFKLDDEEILGALSLFGSIYLAAAAGADTLVARFSGLQQSFKIGDLAIDYGQRVSNYRTLAVQLRAKQSLGEPFVGGVSRSAEQTQREDIDREPNRYNVGQGDFPGRMSPVVPPEDQAFWP